MNVLEKRIKEIEIEVKHLNSERMRYAHKRNNKTRMEALKRQIKKLKIERKTIIELAVKKGYLIDATSMSVISVKSHTARYLRNKDDYYNEHNFIFAKHENTLYAYLTSNINIRSKDLSIMKALIHKVERKDIIFVTDNRHNYCITASKKYTMEIERIFSRIKKPIYRKLKPKQRWANRIFYTDVSIERLFDMYLTQFKKLNVKPLNF